MNIKKKFHVNERKTRKMNKFNKMQRKNIINQTLLIKTIYLNPIYTCMYIFQKTVIIHYNETFNYKCKNLNFYNFHSIFLKIPND